MSVLLLSSLLLQLNNNKGKDNFNKQFLILLMDNEDGCLEAENKTNSHHQDRI